MKEGFKIVTIHAFISEEDDGTEGITAFHTGMGWMPMIAADPERLKDLRPKAEEIARLSGRPVKLIRFAVRSDLETIQPPV